MALAIIGGALVYVGVRATKDKRNDRDRAWFYASGAFNALVLLLAVFAPGIINGWWALDTQPPPRDMNKRVAYSRDQSTPQEGRPLGDDDWADAATESIQQEDLNLRVESAKIGRLADKGQASFVLIHVRMGFVPTGPPLVFEGFTNEKHKPVLTDASGNSFPFQDQRQRKKGRGAPVFELPSVTPIELSPSEPLDMLLVFASPPSKIEDLRLEIPSSAWGRQGMCKLRIHGLIDPPLKK
jgi:hypothetical protein